MLDIPIKLIRNTFRGRHDVVPKWWHSRRGKKGYSPICENEWKDGVCRKPCGSCPNGKYVPLSDALIEKHIKGKHILGVYPLLKDNTCHFIAADFDNHNGDRKPLDDVRAYYEVCEVQEIPLYILRSKSGKGYHAYIFFETPVPARKARVVCFALLKEAQVIGEDTELSSFDRLFPNQDQLTGKGFGNLIALPFQGKAAKNGNTLLLNPENEFTKPYENQSMVLADIQKTTETVIDTLIKEWDLQYEKAQHQYDSERSKPKEKDLQYRPADFEQVARSCPFISHCRADAETLSEPEWYALISIACRCENGQELCHELSKPYPQYDPKETEAKITHAKNDTRPFSCEYIFKNINGNYCKSCNHMGKIKSPILLGASPLAAGDHEEIVEDLNKKHAVIMIGGKCLIMNEIIDPTFKRPDITLSSVNDFKNRYLNKKILIMENSKPKYTSIAQIWLNSPNRRQYEGVVFSPEKDIPGYYNLYRGLAIDPKKGDWSLFNRHILEIIAGGNEDHYEYLLDWMARMVQDPGGLRPGTSVVLRGSQGTGKGCFVTNYGKIFGSHFLHITSQQQLTGRFNHHLKDALLVYCDEAVWGGDKHAEGILKGMITEELIMIEPKGKDAFGVKNNINLIIASNNDWIVPAGLEERRFFVVDVSNAYIGNHEYFNKIYTQMKNGGCEAMLYDLLERDISDVDLRTIPRTEALFDQILNTMPSAQKFWYERLRAGSLTEDGIPWDKIQSSELHGAYLEFAEKIGDRYPSIDKQFGKAIRKFCPQVMRKQERLGDNRTYMLHFPDLDTCRSHFEQIIRIPINWEEEALF